MESELRLSGRRAQARRNDPRIRQAAREVFTADPDAPMSAVAARAGVGISALYRRYGSKEDLLRQVARDGLQQYLDEAEAAVADDRDPWTAFADFMARLLDAQTVAITMNLAGTFTPNDELFAMSIRAAELNDAIVERTKAGGGLRSDVVVDDLSMIIEQVSSIRLGMRRAHESSVVATCSSSWTAFDPTEPTRYPARRRRPTSWRRDGSRVIASDCRRPRPSRHAGSRRGRGGPACPG